MGQFRETDAMKKGFLPNFKVAKHEAYAMTLLALVRETKAPVHQVIRYLDGQGGAELATDISIYLEDFEDKRKNLESSIEAVIEMITIHDEDEEGESLLNRIMEADYSA
jgi:hypothetical protein